MALASLKKGETVLDLGSGGGADAFLAAKAVGPEGRVIGIDMTPDMVLLARESAAKLGQENVEFRLAEIEALPVESGSVDVIISNCVINLSTDKDAVFREAMRVLRPGGRVMVSDIVLVGDLPQEVADNPESWAACVSGALPKDEYQGTFHPIRFLKASSLAKGARVLDDPRYAVAAGRAADFVLSKMRKDGRLHRSYRNGTARLTAYLSDYACMIEGCLNLYEATFDVRWLDEAVALNDVLTAHYYDSSGGGYYFTADDGEALIARSKSPDDGAVPSGNAVQAANLIRMAIILDRKDLREQASSIFRAFAAGLTQSPFTRERSLCSLDMYYGPVKEIVLAGVPSEPKTQELIRTVYGRFLPNKVVCLSPVAESARKALWPRIPLLRNRTPIRDVPAAYVCENYVCQKPVTSPAELAAQLTPR